MAACGNGVISPTPRRGLHSRSIAIGHEGPGLANPGNLFVPFFATKPDGIGTGIKLCRQIAESDGGTLMWVDRSDRPVG